MGTNGDFDMTITVEVARRNGWPHANYTVLRRIRGAIGKRRLKEQADVPLVDVHYGTTRGDDVQSPIAVHVHEPWGSKPVLIPTACKCLAQGWGLNCVGACRYCRSAGWRWWQYRAPLHGFVAAWASWLCLRITAPGQTDLACQGNCPGEPFRLHRKSIANGGENIQSPTHLEASRQRDPARPPHSTVAEQRNSE